MRNSETHKKQINVFGLGANYDLAPEMAMLAKQGYYKDAMNMRIANANQADFALERIKGEEVKYAVNANVSINFTCIGVVEVNYHVVEIWCKDDNTEVAFRIDGNIMLHDTENLMKLSVSHPLQIHKDDSCNGGEFYFVDNVNPPYIYAVQNIIDAYNAGSLIYFGNPIYGGTFNPLLYQTNLTLSLNAPVFVELKNVGGGGGLPTGQYSYSFRYVDDSGNRTLFSPPTPLIPVVKNYDDDSTHYAYSKTYGGAADLTPTDYGITIEFRVDNRLNYSYIEIGRTAWNTNQALGYTPVKQFYRLPIDLANGEFSTKEFHDVDELTWEDLLDEESTESMGAIVTAKAIRYFNGQLVLGNITYASRDLENKITFKTDNGALYHPFIDNIGTAGYADPYNSAYKKQYMSGERFGFGVACYDSLGNISLVLPIDDGVLDMKNVNIRNRRDACSARTIDLCVNNWKGIPRAVDVHNNTGVYVHERYQFNHNNPKTDISHKTLQYNDTYSILHPTKYNDTATSNHNYLVNDEVCTKYDLDTAWIGGGATAYVPYQPYSFSPDIYANGLAIAGLDIDAPDFPSWISAFSIVRTNAAGRVVAQGLSMYDMNDDPQDKEGISPVGAYNVVDKTKNGVWFYSDDVDNGYASVDNGSEVQFVSPVSFFSEVYSEEFYRNTSNVHACSHCDMILYANQFYTNPSSTQSPSLNHDTISGGYWTKFGEWRSTPSVNPFGTPVNGNTKFGISSVSTDSFKGVGRNDYQTISLDSNIYTQTTPQPLSPGGVMDVNHASNQAWHEPFYITNIVNDGRNIIENNINEYILTGHLQKIKSVIGIGNGLAQTIRLVDERWQDCMVNYYSATKTTDNRYISIIDPNTGLEKFWLDITYKTAVDKAAIIAAIAGGGYVTTEHTVTGVYTSIFDSVNDREFYVVFDEVAGLANEFTLPAASTEITVKYDNRIPLIVFGGDSVVGNTIFAPVDGINGSKGEITDNAQLFAWTGFPYPAFKFNDNYKIIANITAGSGINIQDQEVAPQNIIRQMVVSFISESRSHIPYSYCELSGGDSACDESMYEGDNNFPRVHYVMRPNKWKDDDCSSNFSSSLDRIDPQYEDDYPGEFTMWNYGGFRVNPINNRDYSQWNTYDKAFSKPIVGFTEKTKFCSRVAWSLKRNINEQNDPNLKTFTALNVFDISDSTQEIKFLYDNDSNKGNNLIALTGSGICLLLTDKKIISQATGNDLTYLDADKLVSGEYWLSRTIGCSNEFWRGCAEYNNMLFFPNSESVYRLMGLEITDIGRNNNGSYFSKLHPILEDVAVGYRDNVCAVYDVLHNEYWLHINKEHKTSLAIKRGLNLKDGNDGGAPSANMVYTPTAGEYFILTGAYSSFYIIMPGSDRMDVGDVLYFSIVSSAANLKLSYGTPTFSVLSAGYTYRCEYLGGSGASSWSIIQIDNLEFDANTYVFANDPQKQVWLGEYSYVADKMLNIYGNNPKNLNTLLMRNFTAYETNRGYIINGETVDGSVDFYVSPESYATKEFIDQTFNTSQSPTYCYYGNNSGDIEATQLVFKNYTNGYYTQIPRKQDSVRNRFQGKYLWCRVGCDNTNDYILTTTETGYKLIR